MIGMEQITRMVRKEAVLRFRGLLKESHSPGRYGSRVTSAQIKEATRKATLAL
jgi:hypothetical protein